MFNIPHEWQDSVRFFFKYKSNTLNFYNNKDLRNIHDEKIIGNKYRNLSRPSNENNELAKKK